MIAKSDVIILVVSASALAAGIYRWQSNIASFAPVQTTASAPAATTTNANTQAAGIVASGQQAGNNPGLNAASTVVNGNSGSAITVNGSTAVQSSPVGTAVQVSNSNINTAPAAQVSVVNDNQVAGSSNTQAAEPLYGSYRVKSGDYLGKIAQTFGTTVSELRRINNISGSLIEIDQEILYPLPAN